MQSLLKHNEENNLSLKNIYGITLISDNKDIPFWNPSIIKNEKVTISNGYDDTGDLYNLQNVISFIKTCGKLKKTYTSIISSIKIICFWYSIFFGSILKFIK